ncbi:thiamine pyrophosphate-dependent enzyme [Clostridium sp.]|uniref:thiamine pyrophosphate-dependent enzyme n=1 Tax=Clostridium sp. TaxID=1506 RepID=UPI003464A628
MAIVFEPTKALVDRPTHYCPGCTHGIIHRLVGEVLEELNVLDKAIGVAPVGCSVLAYDYFAFDMFQAAHGRAPAVATGIKRSNPDKVVFTYQGDGDLAAIGTSEIVHAATRGENIVTIFVNNCIYGMTGGQMSPTTLPGQVTETSPFGRDIQVQGHPMRVSEMIATLDGACYVERVSVDKVPNVMKTKKAIKKAFENAIAGKGFSMVEVLSICPTNWGLNIEESLQWLRENMIPFYPLGVKKDTTGEVK